MKTAHSDELARSHPSPAQTCATPETSTAVIRPRVGAARGPVCRVRRAGRVPKRGARRPMPRLERVCLEPGWDTPAARPAASAAERKFARNKTRIESGESYRGPEALGRAVRGLAVQHPPCPLNYGRTVWRRPRTNPSGPVAVKAEAAARQTVDKGPSSRCPRPVRTAACRPDDRRLGQQAGGTRTSCPHPTDPPLPSARP
jgi:hypothetical protein